MDKKIFAGLVLAGLAVFLTVEGAEAFCVYNNTDVVVVAEKAGGDFIKAFSKKIPSGGNECCNWKNKDCNPKGKRDSTVWFNVRYLKNDIGFDICTSFAIQAGGWLTVEGSNGNYKCVRHDY